MYTRIQSLREWKESHPVNHSSIVISNVSQKSEAKPTWHSNGIKKLIRSFQLAVREKFYQKCEHFFDTIQDQNLLQKNIASEGNKPVEKSVFVRKNTMIHHIEDIIRFDQVKPDVTSPLPVIEAKNIKNDSSEKVICADNQPGAKVERNRKYLARVIYFFEFDLYKLLRISQIKGSFNLFAWIKSISGKLSLKMRISGEYLGSLVFDVMERFIGDPSAASEKQFRTDLL